MLNLAKLSFFETPCRNPFDRPTNQTSSSTTFSVKGSCSDNADFAFAEFEFESTLVTEWNWVISKYKITVLIFVTAQYCRTPQTSYVQLFYIFGLFVGSFLLGRVADRCSQYAFIHVVLSPRNLASMISKESETSHEKNQVGEEASPPDLNLGLIWRRARRRLYARVLVLRCLQVGKTTFRVFVS